MSDINTVVLSGRLTRDPELRYTQGGTAIADITIASGFKYRDKQGETQEDTAFAGCSVFGPMAEFAAKCTRKGGRVNIQGRLVTEKWEDKQTGKNKSRTRIKVTQVQPIDWADDNQGERPPQTQQAPPKTSDTEMNVSVVTTRPNNDDVPF